MEKMFSTFDKEIIMLSSQGLEKIFKDCASIFIELEAAVDFTDVAYVAKAIRKEVRDITYDREVHKGKIDFETAVEEVSPTLTNLPSE